MIPQFCSIAAIQLASLEKLDVSKSSLTVAAHLVDPEVSAHRSLDSVPASS